jgi:hypothetical protein
MSHLQAGIHWADEVGALSRSAGCLTGAYQALSVASRNCWDLLELVLLSESLAQARFFVVADTSTSNAGILPNADRHVVSA